YGLEGRGFDFGMAAVQCADAYGDGEIVRRLFGFEREVLRGHGPEAEVDAVVRRLRLCNGFGRPVYAEHYTCGADALGHLARHCPWSAADLEHAESGLQGKRVDDFAQSRRELGH